MDELLNVRSNNETNAQPNDAELEKFYSELLLKSQNEQAADGNQSQEPKEKNWNSVKPTPGICVKSRIVGDGGKVFINICTSSAVPAPKPITEQELLTIIDEFAADSDETINYRVPMSIGEAHVEVDKHGKACTAYDVIINPNFLTTIKESRVFFGFLMSIVLEGLQNKYEVQVDRNWAMLKNKKFFGRVEEQRMRKKALIQEVSSQSGGRLTEEKTKEPRYVLVREPETGHPEFLIAEIELLGVEKASNLMVDAGEDRLVVSTRPKKYSLDIYLPFDLLPEEIGSQFDVSTHVLTVTMPVKPLDE